MGHKQRVLFLCASFVGGMNCIRGNCSQSNPPSTTRCWPVIYEPAAQGAREMLLSRRKRRSIEQLIKTIEHVALETMPDFFEVFVEGCQIKPMRVSD